MAKKLLSTTIFIALFIQVCFPVWAQDGPVQQDPVNSTDTGTEQEMPKTESPDSDTLTLPVNTPLNLIMLEQLYSQRNREGDEIVFALTDDVVLMGKTYLVAGTPVIGRVSHSTAAKSWGRSGNMDIEITSIVPPYGMPIPLAGSTSGTGGNTTVASVATTVLLGISVIGLLAGGSVDGHGAVIPAGTTVTVFTAQDGTISDLSKEEMQSMIDDWYKNKVVMGFLSYSPAGVTSVGSALAQLGYKVDPDKVTLDKIDQYNYAIHVEVAPGQIANFTFQPFEDVHGWKFNTLLPIDALAKSIFSRIK